MLFKNGTREPLHGHNYRVQMKGKAPQLSDDMVFDFLNIKPLVKQACDALDHKLLLPEKSADLQITENGENYHLRTRDESFFSLPKKDVVLMPIENTSVERIASYLAYEIKRLVHEKFQFQFIELEIEVEESPGQSATFTLLENTPNEIF